MFYHLIKALARLYTRAFFRVRVYGLEHLETHKPFILAANHISNNDPILILDMFPSTVYFLAKKELFSYWLSNWFFTKMNAIAVDRKSGMVIRPVRRALKLLQAGEVIGIFPQGKRCKKGENVRIKRGVAFLSRRTMTPIIPIALHRESGGIRQRLTIIIGKPIDLVQAKFRHETDQSIAEYVMTQIERRMLNVEEETFKLESATYQSDLREEP